jgi:hypothetical protein
VDHTIGLSQWMLGSWLKEIYLGRTSLIAFIDKNVKRTGHGCPFVLEV